MWSRTSTYPILLLFMLMSLLIQAQTPQTIDPILPVLQLEQDPCGAIPICGNFSCPFVYNEFGYVQSQYNWGLLEQNSVWFCLKIASAGDLVFNVIPFGPSNSFYFVAYNVTGINPCSSPLPFSTAFNYVPGSNTPSTITVNAGDEYLILVDHIFDVQFQTIYASGFSLDFTGSTATFVNESLPAFKSIKPTCNKSQQIGIKLSEPIKCSSIAANGSDFHIAPALGSIIGAYGFNCTLSGASDSYTDEVRIQFAAPLPLGNYWLHAQAGNDGNTLLDLCDGELLIPDSVSFAVEPYDPITFTGLDSPACQFLIVGLSHKVLCDSIAADGSDFNVVGPSNVSIRSAIGTNCDMMGLVDTILVELEEPIYQDGVYSLQSKVGTDNNTLLDTCFGRQLVGDQVFFKLHSFNGILQASPDTVLCKADTIQLSANAFQGQSPQYICGLDTNPSNHPCFSITKEISGVPGTAIYGGFGGVYGIFPKRIGLRKQMLYRASELNAMGLKAGIITKLSTVVKSGVFTLIPNPLPSWWPPAYPTYENYTIKIGCTNDMAIQNTMTEGLSIAYSVANFTPVAGINEFVLTNPFVWDGSSNLIVEICFKWDTSGIASSPVTFAASKASKTSFNATSLWLSNVNDGCSMTSLELSEGDNSYRPDFYFTICTQGNSDPGPYSWSPVELITGDTTGFYTAAYIPSTSTVQVSTFDRFGCVLRDSLDVIVSDLHASISPVDTSVCIGKSVQLIANAGTGSSYYNWFSPSLPSLTCLTCNNPVASTLDTTEYFVAISDRWGCADTLSSLVNTIPLPDFKIQPGDTIIKYGSSLSLMVNGDAYYTWIPGGSLNYPNTNNPIATPFEPTDYVVFGLGRNGCWNSDTIHVDIDYSANLFVPSAFSPGADGKNNLFRVANLTFQRVQEFRVFNRWGQQVFSACDNRGWDGTYKGLPQEVGVYKYLIRIGTPDGFSKIFKGDVTLVR